ncbi:hypothetical protein [Paenibacillus lentus]|uniref:Uncharacterized protein n=1 Tax=Paenibacillus lentus TaxID=1338368 RepID=A0A3Q8SAL4_9BACL|nr:hypothetical protein [Paenibacillus lentus]AZK46279.1 hypothetical protein EIM92_08880 [Paenibacillus lentus]
MRSPKAFIIQYLRKQRKPRGTPLLNMLFLLSVLLFYLSGQIRITYGEFASSSDAAVTFSTCGIFPDAIEGRLSQVHMHIKNASAIKNQLHSFNASTIKVSASPPFTPAPTTPLPYEPFIPPANTAIAPAASLENVTSATYRNADMDSFNAYNLSERESAAEFISLQITLSQESMIAINERLTTNTLFLQKIMQELEAGSSHLNDVIQQIQLNPANCAKFSQSTLLDEVETLLNQDNPLSPSFYASMTDLMEYLRQVYDAGIAIQNVPNSLTNQLSQRDSDFRSLRKAAGFATSPELLQYYHDLQSSLESQKQAISSEIQVLESRLTDIKKAADPEAGSVDHRDSASESDLDVTEEMESHFQNE